MTASYERACSPVMFQARVKNSEASHKLTAREHAHLLEACMLSTSTLASG